MFKPNLALYTIQQKHLTTNSIPQFTSLVNNVKYLNYKESKWLQSESLWFMDKKRHSHNFINMFICHEIYLYIN